MVDKTSSFPREVFRRHYGMLQQSITSGELLTRHLYSKKLIGQGTKSRVTFSSDAPVDKAGFLLDAVEATLKASSQPWDVLKKLCDVLEETDEVALGDIAGRMRSRVDGDFP